MKLPSNPRPKRLDEIIDTLPEARRQKVEAEAKALIAESTGSYLSSMYGNSDDDEEAEEVSPRKCRSRTSPCPWLTRPWF